MDSPKDRPPSLAIRRSLASDAPAITAIYNHAIQNTTASFYEEPRTVQQTIDWMENRPGRYVVLSAELNSGSRLEQSHGESGGRGGRGSCRDTMHESVNASTSRLQPVVGWASLEPWTEKHGYRITTEISYYIDPEFHRRGIGTKLVERLIQVARENGFRNLLAKICEDNVGSRKLAQRFEFAKVGTLLAIGEKFGRSWDVDYYQKRLTPLQLESMQPLHSN